MVCILGIVSKKINPRSKKNMKHGNEEHKFGITNKEVNSMHSKILTQKGYAIIF